MSQMIPCVRTKTVEAQLRPVKTYSSGSPALRDVEAVMAPKGRASQPHSSPSPSAPHPITSTFVDVSSSPLHFPAALRSPPRKPSKQSHRFSALERLERRLQSSSEREVSTSPQPKATGGPSCGAQLAVAEPLSRIEPSCELKTIKTSRSQSSQGLFWPVSPVTPLFPRATSKELPHENEVMGKTELREHELGICVTSPPSLSCLQQRNAHTMQDMPFDCLGQIATFLSPGDILKGPSLVSWHWCEAVLSDDVWESLLHRLLTSSSKYPPFLRDMFWRLFYSDQSYSNLLGTVLQKPENATQYRSLCCFAYFHCENLTQLHSTYAENTPPTPKNWLTPIILVSSPKTLERGIHRFSISNRPNLTATSPRDAYRHRLVLQNDEQPDILGVLDHFEDVADDGTKSIKTKQREVFQFKRVCWMRSDERAMSIPTSAESEDGDDNNKPRSFKPDEEELLAYLQQAGTFADPRHAAVHTTRSVYNQDIRQWLLGNVCFGFDSCLLTYGCQGTGKTQTMIGCGGPMRAAPKPDESAIGSVDDDGIVILALRDLVNLFSDSIEDRSTLIELQCFEMVCTKVVDFISLFFEEAATFGDNIISDGNTFDLRLQQPLCGEDDAAIHECRVKTPKISITPTGAMASCSALRVTRENLPAVIAMLQTLAAQRREPSKFNNSTIHTALHNRFSTLACNVTILRHVRSPDNTSLVVSSNAMFVDMASSDKIRASGVRVADVPGCPFSSYTSLGSMGLSTFRRVIDTLIDNHNMKPKRKKIPPYRESLLTYLLADGLGGRCSTKMITTVSPHECDVEDTLGSLRYSLRAKAVENLPCQPSIATVQEALELYDEYLTREKEAAATVDELNVQVRDILMRRRDFIASVNTKK